MFNNRYGSDYQSPLLHLADQILSLELIWPLPLVVVGVLGVRDPLVAGIAIILALIPWLARLLVFGRLTRRAFVGSALGLLVVSALVGVWAAYDPALSWPMLLTLLGSVSLFFAVINSAASPWRVGGGLVILAALLAFYFAVQYAHFDYRGEAGRVARLARMTGSLAPDLVFFTPHPNAVAGFLEGTFLLSLALIRRARSGKQLAWGLALVIIAYGLFISGSRGSWVGLAVAIGIWALLLIPSRALRLAVGGVWIAVILLGLYVVVRRVSPEQQVFAISSALKTAGSRFVLYRNSFYLLGDYPFTGIGLGDTFAMIYSRYQLLIQVPFLTYSHNLFLSVGLGQGVLGLTALVWLLIGFYRFVLRVERAGLPGGPLRGRARSLPLFRAAWLGATATFVHGLTDSPQFSGSYWTMPVLFVLLGVAVAMGRPVLLRASGENVSEVAKGWRRRRVGMAALTATAMAMVVVAVVFQRPLMGAWYANLGAIHQTRADLSPDLDETAREAAMARAVTYFERALSLNPSQPVANRRLGMMALDLQDFDAAVAYLERAYPREPGNQATLKAFGLANLWTGQLDRAEALLQQLDSPSEVVEELGIWRWWWGTQDREDLSAYAGEMIRRLSEEN